MRSSITLLTLVLVACIPAAPPPARPPAAHAPPVVCEGTPDPSPSAERGVTAFASASELEAAVGSTVFLVRSGGLQQHDARLGAGVPAVFGTPLLLCAASTTPNRHIVQSEELARARNVLVKTPGGVLVDVRISDISPRTPWFSLATPEEATAMLVGAFRELRDAGARGRTAHEGGYSEDRGSPDFWAAVAHEQRKLVAEDARRLLGVLIGGMGRYERFVDRTYRVPKLVERGAGMALKGEDERPWVDHADATVQRLAQFGIPDGPVRERYGKLVACGGSAPETNKACIEAAMVVAAPPAIPAEATRGGSLVLRIAPKRVLATVTVELAGKRVPATGEYVTVPVDEDGVVRLVVSAPGMRTFERSVDVRHGRSVEVPVVLLPR